MISEFRLIVDGYDGMFYSDVHVDSIEDGIKKAEYYLEVPLDVTIVVANRAGKVVKKIK